jgi:hypothetical protein
VPGLLRDLAAEVSDIHAVVLDDALSLIGIDATAEGGVPAALSELDSSMAAEHGSSGLVANLVRLNWSDDDQVSWTAIANTPRGETGKALLDVFRTFGESADALRSAVAADYRQESDAALLGYRVDVAPKA